jgi:hypothetical protein
MTSLQKRAVVTAGANLLAAQGADLRQREGLVPRVKGPDE